MAYGQTDDIDELEKQIAGLKKRLASEKKKRRWRKLSNETPDNIKDDMRSFLLKLKDEAGIIYYAVKVWKNCHFYDIGGDEILGWKPI